MNIAIIVAGGSGKRMGKKKNKIFLKLVDKPIIYHTLKIFENHQKIHWIIISAQKKDIAKIRKIVADSNFKKVCCIVEALDSRQNSVDAAINAITRCCKPKQSDLLVIHNAVNPFVTPREIDKVLSAAKTFGAALLAIPAVDTIKLSNKNNFVKATLDRQFVFQAQTPQVIRYGLAKKVYRRAKKGKFIATDDVMLVEKLKKKVKIIPCSRKNFKITYPEDLKLAEILMKLKPKN